MDVRVWGVVGDRLIELRVQPAAERSSGLQIEGLPAHRARTTADRIRAALLNSGVVLEAPPVLIRLEPRIEAGIQSDLDLTLALGALAHIGVVGAGLRWILATGRLGLDGTVHVPGLAERRTLADVVESLCQTPLVESERMFEREGR